MGLKSMTGYGCGHASADGLKVQVEISSVNRKQFDAHLTLPKSIGALESRMLEVMHEAIARGHLTGNVTISVSETARRRGVRVDADLAEAYVRRIRDAALALGLRDDLSATALLRLPEVVSYQYVEADVEYIWPILLRALRQALGQLVHMRNAEGAALAQDLGERLRKLSVHLRDIRTLAPAVTEKYRTALHGRLRRAGFATGSGDQQVLKELALFAERSDISEEITRLDSHLRQALKFLKSKESVGRTLDFLAQEMLREINTIASKANDTAIVRHVIHFKTELERIREQVQNIE